MTAQKNRAYLVGDKERSSFGEAKCLDRANFVESN
jgi:hypothetical protein